MHTHFITVKRKSYKLIKQTPTKKQWDSRKWGACSWQSSMDVHFPDGMSIILSLYPLFQACLLIISPSPNSKFPRKYVAGPGGRTGSRTRYLWFYSQTRYATWPNNWFSHPLDKNIPFYRCQRFFYPGLLPQPRLWKVSQSANHCLI